jgi:hypothetical protein
MRIDDDFDVDAAATMAMPKVVTDLGADAVTARKVEGTLREMFETTLSRPNAFNKLDESIVRYFSLLSKMATDKRNEIKKEKDLYEKTYKVSATMIPKIAQTKLTFAALAMPTALLGMSPNRLDTIAGTQLSQTIIPSLGGMASAGQEATMRRADAVSGLAMQELNNQTSQAQAEGNEKSGLDQILANKNNAMKEAARAG